MNELVDQIKAEPLRAYVARTEPGEVSVLLFAISRARAKQIASRSDWFGDCAWTDLRVRREPAADVHAARFGEGYLDCASADQQRILRDLGWHELEHSQEQCCVCQKYEWDRLKESKLTLTDEVRGYYTCAGCLAKNAATGVNLELRKAGKL